MSKTRFSIYRLIKPNRYALGIEISDYAVKLAEVRIPARGRPEMIHSAVERLPEGAVTEGRIQDRDEVLLALRKIVSRKEFRTRNVHMILPGTLVTVRFMKMPDLPEAELRKVIDFEVRHNMHLPFDNPVYDFVKINGSAPPPRIRRKKKRKQKNSDAPGHPLKGMEEAAAALEPAFGAGAFIPDADSMTNAEADVPQCDVMLAAVPREQACEYAEIIREAGLRIRSLEIKPFSLLRLLSGLGRSGESGAVMAVDVGENAADFSVFYGRELKITRNIPVNFGSDAGKLSASLFEETDADYGFRAACFDLADEIERLMNFYRYSLNHREHEFGCVLLLGDAPRLAEIGSLLSERLTTEVRLIEPAAVSSPVPQFERQFPALAVPIGLALREKPA
jgi:Tfp pilus assembly PilM family ATPase